MGKRNLTEFNYRIADEKEAHIFVGVQIQNRADAEKMAESLIGMKTRIRHTSCFWDNATPPAIPLRIVGLNGIFDIRASNYGTSSH